MNPKININENKACTIEELISILQFFQKKCGISNYNIYFNGYYLTEKITINESDKSIELTGFPVINEEID
jgi:hypothetical protein